MKGLVNNTMAAEQSRILSSHLSVDQQIVELARLFNVVYVETDNDLLAGELTSLAGDEVVLDPTTLLIIALQRAGTLSKPAAMHLIGRHIHEQQ